MTRASTINAELYSALVYIRGSGARLVPDCEYGFRIEPIIDGVGANGWKSREIYDQEKQCLQPHAEQVIGLLQWLKENER